MLTNMLLIYHNGNMVNLKLGFMALAIVPILNAFLH